MEPHSLKKAFGMIVLKALLALFLVPGLTLGLANWFKHDADRDIGAYIAKSIAADKKMSATEKEEANAFYAALKPSAACSSTAPEAADYRQGVCERYSELWQYVTVERVALGTVVTNFVLLLIMAGLGALAFSNRSLQYASFVFGWRLLTITSALEIVIQGAFAVWLSFWLTAHFFHSYSIKLIACVALLVAAAVFTALVAIFRRAQMENSVQGEIISPQQAPALWAKIRDFARRLGTAPPQQLVGGIDANFFVTETPLRVGQHTTQGRTLFVSLPLLRQLESHEADAVLAHELGHFSGGDTENSAKLSPKLAQYDYYTSQMQSGGTTIIAYYLLNLYRVIFEMALQQSSRQREFAADSVAAQITSPQAVVNALIKVAAYAQYRHRVEAGLFRHQERHDDNLGIANRVASGLAAFGQSSEFAEAMRAANVPHPFDSHPPLPQRMENVGHTLPESQFAGVVCQVPLAPWTNHIFDVDAIEQRQWQAFEQQFAQEHEESLAWRYEPATPEERALVERYFPPVRFELKKGTALTIDCDGMELPGTGERMSWDRVQGIEYNDKSLGGDIMVIKHPEKGLIGAKTTKVSIAYANKKDRDRFKGVLGHYWQRHQYMRAAQRQMAEENGSPGQT